MSLFLFSRHTIAFDVDTAALGIAVENAIEYDLLDRIDFVQCDLLSGFPVRRGEVLPLTLFPSSRTPCCTCWLLARAPCVITMRSDIISMYICFVRVCVGCRVADY